MIYFRIYVGGTFVKCVLSSLMTVPEGKKQKKILGGSTEGEKFAQ